MRRVLLTVALILVTGPFVFPLGQEGANNNSSTKGASVQAQGSTWTIYTDKEKYLPSDPIILTFTRRNDTARSLNFGTPPEIVWVHSLNVTLPNGEPAPPTLYYHRWDRGVFAGWGGSAPSGFVQTNTVQLDRFFDMTLAGDYRISLRKRLSEGSTNEIVSPPLTIRVDDSNLKK